MYPPLFGEKLWDAALIVALNLAPQPQEIHKRFFVDFIYGLVHLVPCGSCSSEAINYVSTNPPKVDSRDAAVAWVVQFHNFVNKKIGKATFTVQEATQALVARLGRDFQDLPMAMQRRKEDSKRIEELQAQVQKLQGGGVLSSFGSSNSETFMWVAVAEAILLLLLIITIIILSIRLKKK